MTVRVRDEHVLLLTWTAGCVDTLSYRGLDHVFVANMTGNTVLLGIALSQGDYRRMLLTSVTLGGFCLGAFGGGWCLFGHGKQALWTGRRMVVVMAETALLVAFGAIWLGLGAPPHPSLAWLLLLCASLAMGLQSVLALSLALPGLTTTYLTGSMAQIVIAAAHWLHLALCPKAHEEERREVGKDQQNMARLSWMWFVFALAALVSGALFTLNVPVAICNPLAANVLVVLDAQVRHWWQRWHQ